MPGRPVVRLQPQRFLQPLHGFFLPMELGQEATGSGSGPASAWIGFCGGAIIPKCLLQLALGGADFSELRIGDAQNPFIEPAPVRTERFVMDSVEKTGGGFVG